MAKQTVGIGSTANDGNGDTARVAFDKINDNFNEIYSGFGDGSSLGTYQVQLAEGAFADGDKTKLDGIEALADVTDATNVAAAGAAMAATLASTSNGDGASLIGVEDSGTNWTATDVEGVLAEIPTKYPLLTALASTANGAGASLIGLEDAAGNLTATDVEAGIAEIFTKLAATGGAALVGINNTATGFTATTVQALVGELSSLADDLDTWRGENPGDYLQTWNIVAFNAGGDKDADRPPGYAIVVWYNHGNEPPTYATGNDIYTLPDGTVFVSAKTANYTITDADMGRIIEASSGTLTFTLDTNANEAITLVSGAWREFGIVNSSGNTLTIDGATGVTVNGSSGGSVTIPDGGVATAAKIATDQWFIYGNVS